MRHLEVNHWEVNHPLNGKPCPVTGRMVHIEPHWTVLRPDYRLRTGILEPGVILSLPVGYTAINDTHNFFRNLSLICKSPHLDPSNFVLIEDYSFHTGSDYEGRIHYIQRMVDEINPAGIVLFTRSVSWKLAIRMGRILGGNPFPIRIANSYREALQIASDILRRPIDGMHISHTHDRLYSPHFGFNVQVQSAHLVLAQYGGCPNKNDLPSIINIYQALPENKTLAEHYTTIHDFAALKTPPFLFLGKLLRKILSEQCNEKSSPPWIVSESVVLRSLIFLWKYFRKSQRAIRVFSDLDTALATIHPISGSQATTIGSNSSLQQDALELLGKMDWDQPGYLEFDKVDTKALEPLALVLGSLKQDVDFYLRERQKELELQEETYRKFLRLSTEIEQALKESEQDRLNSEELSKKNLALAIEISQSQKAVFIVLADYIDRRSNMSEGYTRRLAQMVGKMAPLLGYSQKEAERLQDATQLFHVGYIGVPEGEQDLTAHCLLGGQVLESIKVSMIKYASQIARYHHEKWNGSGSPDGLIGNNIPQEARLVALAEVIQLHSTEHLDLFLRKEAGNSLDPKMVDAILLNLNLILEWKKGDEVTSDE